MQSFWNEGMQTCAASTDRSWHSFARYEITRPWLRRLRNASIDPQVGPYPGSTLLQQSRSSTLVHRALGRPGASLPCYPWCVSPFA